MTRWRTSERSPVSAGKGSAEGGGEDGADEGALRAKYERTVAQYEKSRAECEDLRAKLARAQAQEEEQRELHRQNVKKMLQVRDTEPRSPAKLTCRAPEQPPARVRWPLSRCTCSRLWRARLCVGRCRRMSSYSSS